MPSGTSSLEYLFGPGSNDPGKLWPRWLWLRALGLIFFSAFYSLAFQIRSLIGPDGILPAETYLAAVLGRYGFSRFWYAPTLLWMGSGPGALRALCFAGFVGSLLLIFNWWPRLAIAVCFLAYLSFVSAARDFADYQSDGMLLAAAFLSLFVAPSGFRPGLGHERPPSRAAVFMLQWLWFCIYFESGAVKLLSHDPEWRHLTALDQYYQNGPLPNWIGWYAEQLPHGFQAAIALATLIIELGIAWFMFLPRPFRLLCFFIVTPFQIGIILTANLAFLNHLVLALGVLLLDDRFILRIAGWVKARLRLRPAVPGGASGNAFGSETVAVGKAEPQPAPRLLRSNVRLAAFWRRLSIVVPAVLLIWIFYCTALELLMIFAPSVPLPPEPAEALAPFRIAGRYGLFAVMTTARYEIEFQGSADGTHWIAYPFRYKPQRLDEAPRFYAPYQPRFDWNLWFASLATWRQYPWVLRVEVELLHSDPALLTLFAANPFPDALPKEVRAVEWQYWFTDLKTKRATGLWWRREFRGLYGPVVELGPGGKPAAPEWPKQ